MTGLQILGLNGNFEYVVVLGKDILTRMKEDYLADCKPMNEEIGTVDWVDAQINREDNFINWSEGQYRMKWTSIKECKIAIHWEEINNFYYLMETQVQ